MKATVSKGLEEMAREIARIQGQRAKPKSTGNGSWTATPPFAHADRPFTVAKWTVGRVTPGAASCENPRSATELSDRSWTFLKGV